MAIRVGGQLQVKAIPAARDKAPNVIRKEAGDDYGAQHTSSQTLLTSGPSRLCSLVMGSPAFGVFSFLSPLAELSPSRTSSRPLGHLAPPFPRLLSSVDLQACLHRDNASVCCRVDCRQRKQSPTSIQHTS